MADPNERPSYDRQLFAVRLAYFWDSGRLQADVNQTHRFRAREDGHLVSFGDVVAWVRGLRQSGGQWGMPGLGQEDYPEDGPPEAWGGFVLIECDGNSRLLLPEGAEEA
jgi:hypothetical protein